MINLIVELSNLWGEYYSLELVDGSLRADKIINGELKHTLSELNKDKGFNNLTVGSSSGEGRITRAPWLASFDSRVTKSATQGFYVVFLFSTDMKTLTLELGLGATQFTNFYGQNKKALEEIRNAALRMQYHAAPIATDLCDSKQLDKLLKGPSRITNKKGYSLQRGYEEGAILHFEYEISNLPDEDALKKDYEILIRIYQSMVESKEVPNNIELLSSSIEKVEFVPKPKKVEFVEFNARIKPKKTSGVAKAINSKKYSSSKNTKAIGDWGEQFVLDCEIKYLQSKDRADLASKVVHEEAENNRPGWDITSFDTKGNVKRIEVKATLSKSFNSLNLTANELAAAETYRDSYYLYLVTEVNYKGAKKVEVLCNPASLIENGSIQIRPTMHEVKLFSYEE